MERFRSSSSVVEATRALDNYLNLMLEENGILQTCYRRLTTNHHLSGQAETIKLQRQFDCLVILFNKIARFQEVNAVTLQSSNGYPNQYFMLEANINIERAKYILNAYFNHVSSQNKKFYDYYHNVMKTCQCTPTFPESIAFVKKICFLLLIQNTIDFFQEFLKITDLQLFLKQR